MISGDVIVEVSFLIASAGESIFESVDSWIWGQVTSGGDDFSISVVLKFVADGVAFEDFWLKGTS